MMNSCSSQALCNAALLGSIFLILFIPNLLLAQPDVLWSKTLGGAANELNVTSVATQDGGYLLASASNSTDTDISLNHGKYDIWLTKLDEAGELLWDKSFGGSQQDYPSAICATSDQHYVIAGHTYSDDGDVSVQRGKGDAWLVKVDEAGTLLWQKSYGGTEFDAAYAITTTQDGGYMLAGVTYSAGIASVGKSYGGADYWVLKLDAAGEVLWQRTYGGAKMDVAYAIIETTTGNFVIAGNSLSFPAEDNTATGLTDCWVVSIDPTGEIQWAESFGGFAANKKPRIIETSDGGFALTGNYPVLDLSNENGKKYYENFWLVKLNSEGEQAWQKNYGGKGYDHANSIQATPDGGFLLAGYSWSENTFVAGQEGIADFYVLKLDETGTLEWHQNYGGSAYDEAQHILIDTDGNYLLAGTSRSGDQDVPSNVGAQDLWVMKLKGPFQLIADLGEDLATCPKGLVELNAYLEDCENCTYLWNDANEDSIRIVQPEMSTTYQVTITDANGNTSTDALEVVVLSPVNYTATISAPSCADTNDGQIEITTENTNALQYAWSNNVNTANNAMLAAGSYTLVITDENNCETTADFDLAAPAALAAEMLENKEVSCFGGDNGTLTIGVTGGTGAYQYQWSNGSTMNQIEQLTAGMYSVSISDDNACELIEAFEVTESKLLEILPEVEPISCFDEKDGAIYLTALGGVAPYQYEWDNGTTDENLFDLTAGAYLVSLTDQNGCEQVLTVEVAEPEALEVALSLEQVTGSAANGSIFVDQIIGGTPPYEVFVERAGEILSAPYMELAAGNYLVRVVDQRNCTYEEEVVLDFTESAQILVELDDFLLYPNPTTGNFVIKLGFKQAQAFDLHIYNAMGQLVIRQTYDAVLETKIHQDLSALERGTYLLVVQNEAGKMSQRIILQ